MGDNFEVVWEINQARAIGELIAAASQKPGIFQIKVRFYGDGKVTVIPHHEPVTVNPPEKK